MWPGESAVGKHYRVAPHLMKTPWFEIIGVVGHVRHDAIDVDARAQAYWPTAQWPQDRVALVVKAERSAPALAASMVRAIHDIDPEQPVYDVRTMAPFSPLPCSRVIFRRGEPHPLIRR